MGDRGGGTPPWAPGRDAWAGFVAAEQPFPPACLAGDQAGSGVRWLRCGWRRWRTRDVGGLLAKCSSSGRLVSSHCRYGEVTATCVDGGDDLTDGRVVLPDDVAQEAANPSGGGVGVVEEFGQLQHLDQAA